VLLDRYCPGVLAILPISTTYQIFGLLHVLAAICAFGPLFLYPRMHRAGETQAIAKMHMRFVFPSLVVLWVLGMGMAGIGKYDLAETHWVSAAIVVWLVALVVSWFLIRPSISDTGEAAGKKMNAGIGVTHLTLIVGLWLMIFQPGGTTLK
jgi:hypothetical protein